MHSVTVYGFGSYFTDGATANDVDLLIIYPGTDATSCELAIQCKHRLTEHIACAHVTMLSVSEEAHFQFIKRARAVCLGAMRKSLDEDFEALLAAVYKHT